MRRDRLPGVLLALAGVGIALEATTFDVAFASDPVGPKALPLLAAALMIGAGLRTAAHPAAAVRWPSRELLARIAAAAGAFTLYALALGFLGFFLSTTLVVAALSHLYDAPPRYGIPAAAVLSGALWLLFVELLALPLPIGDLWIR